MEKQYTTFINAAGDLNLNDTPFRDVNDNFKYTRGQLSILNDPQANKLNEVAIELTSCRSEYRKIQGEIIAYKVTAELSEAEHTTALNEFESKIKEEESTLKVRKYDLDVFRQAVDKRGLLVGDELSGQPKGQKVSRVSNWKSILYFLGTWLIGELFMSYVIWNDLREDKTIEDLVVRSLSFGVVLFLVHLVAHYNENHKKLIYYCFLAFSMITLLIMLFAPLILNKVYPVGEMVSSTVEQWSMTNGTDAKQEVDVNPAPVWVDLYRDYEMMPAVLCFLFFIAIQSFTTRDKVTEKEPDLELNPIEQQFNNHKVKVRISEELLGKLTSEREQTVDAHKKTLTTLYEEQEKSYKYFRKLQKDIDSLESSFEQLVNGMERELNAYKIEYMDLLKDDEVKRTIIKPEWPNRSDILNYYKITAL